MKRNLKHLAKRKLTVLCQAITSMEFKNRGNPKALGSSVLLVARNMYPFPALKHFATSD